MKELTKKQKANMAAGRAKLEEKRQLKTEEVKLEEPKPAEVKSVTKKAEKSPFDKRKFFLLSISAVGFGLTILLGKIWFADPLNLPIVGMATCLALAGSAVLAFTTLKTSSARVRAIRAGQSKVTGPVNSINIYAKRDPDNPKHLIPDRVEFAFVENPPGLLRKLRNDGKYYYVNIHDTTGLKDLVLPDNQYCDRRRFLIPVQMKHSQEYYTPIPSLMQRIKPLLFLGLIIVGGLILVITAPPPGG
jgi:hypothetical protein